MADRQIPNMTTADMRAALRTLYTRPEWALMFEVRNAAGFDSNRSADAVAMHLWPSRGLEIRGIEIKVSRSDWRRELKNPEKAEVIAQYCDTWWVAAPAGLVPIEEMPAGWGLQEWDGKKWRTAKAAEKKPAAPLTRDFVAPLLRRACEIDAKEIEAIVKKRVAASEAYITKAIEDGIDRRTLETKVLRDAVRAFEAAAGIKIEDAWTAGEIGQAVRVIRAIGVTNTYVGANHILAKLDSLAARLRQELTAAGFTPQPDGRTHDAYPERAE